MLTIHKQNGYYYLFMGNKIIEIFKTKARAIARADMIVDTLTKSGENFTSYQLTQRADRV